MDRKKGKRLSKLYYCAGDRPLGPGMYVLRDRLITAEFWDFVLSTETCYFVNKRLKTRKSEFSAVSNGVEPNAELYSDVRIYNYDFTVSPRSSCPVYIVSYLTFYHFIIKFGCSMDFSVWPSYFQICTVDVVSWKSRCFYTVLSYP